VDPPNNTIPDNHGIKLDLTNDPQPNATPPAHNNLFYARPEFPATATPADKAAAHARFRLANWGSTIGTTTSLSWANIPGGDNVAYDPTVNQCHFVWPTNGNVATDPVVAGYRSTVGPTALERFDQCMLVELTSTATDAQFSKDSVYANMHIVNGSRYTQDATIDVRGLAPLGPQPRDVLLYLQTTNMPGKLPSGGGGDGGDVSPGQFLPRGVAKFESPIEFPPGRTVDDLAAVLPTYCVHAFYDTGLRSTRLGPDPQPVWRPMTSFGYFVNHTGSLVGWAAQLQGAIRLSDRLYLLRVPNGGTATVTTVVQALEPGDTPDPLPPIQPWPGPAPTPFPVILETLDTVEDIIEAKVSGLVGPTIAAALDNVEDTVVNHFKSVLGIFESQSH
jgi:hypothetical protein